MKPFISILATLFISCSSVTHAKNSLEVLGVAFARTVYEGDTVTFYRHFDGQPVAVFIESQRLLKIAVKNN